MSRLEQELQHAHWHCKPPAWTWSNGALNVTTGKKTDFWQGTLYGFRRDDGHFLGRSVESDFTAVLTFEAHYKTLYDQAGLMFRRDAENWLKAGIEFSDGLTNFSVVITTEGRSDWSVIAAPGISGAQQIRLTRLDDAVIVHRLDQMGRWQLIRLGNMPVEGQYLVGPMTCTPQRSGLEVQFTDFEIGPPIDNPLHSE